MCVTSQVVDVWRQPGPNQIHWPSVQRDPVLAAQMLEVLQKLEALDQRLGTVECKVDKSVKDALKQTLGEIAAKRIDLHRVETGVPMPASKRSSSPRAAIRRLRVGDSLVVRGFRPPSAARARPKGRPHPSSAVRRYFRENNYEYAYTHEGVPAGFLRIWRTK